MKVDIEIFANEGYVHDLIRSDIEQRMQAAKVNYAIHNVDDINAFISEGLESVPTIRINYRKRFSKSEGQSLEELSTQVCDYIIQQPHLKIVCPIDFSRHSINAVHWAHKFGAAAGMSLQIAHVVFPTTEPHFGTPLVMETQLLQSRKHLDELVESITSELSFQVNVSTQLDIGDPVQRITQYSKEPNTGFLVLGTHGASDMMQKLFGSVSSTVAEHAHVPVILVPPNAQYRKPERIMVALHDEFLTNGQLNTLIKLNTLWNAHVNFVYVRQDEDHYEALKGKLLERLTQDTIPTFSYTIDRVNPGASSTIAALMDHARRINPDLMVLVNRNRSYLRRLFRPGVTRGVVIQTKWPVLVMHEA